MSEFQSPGQSGPGQSGSSGEGGYPQSGGYGQPTSVGQPAPQPGYGQGGQPGYGQQPYGASPYGQQQPYGQQPYGASPYGQQQQPYGSGPGGSTGGSRSNPLGSASGLASILTILGYVVAGLGLLAGILILTANFYNGGSFKLSMLFLDLAVGAGLGGTCLGLGALLKQQSST